MILPAAPQIASNVRIALAEDIGTGDVSAALVPADDLATARVICRQATVVAGTAWFEQSFHQLDPEIQVQWRHGDGDMAAARAELCTLTGSSRCLLTSERTALNFLQLLSATATETHRYVQAVSHTNTKILDTRKTIPGLRLAQKYAVSCGGGHNHRVGLYDAFLIKENHIAAAGSIAAAVNAAKATRSNLLIEIEVETLAQLTDAIEAGAQRVMLDNFDLELMREAVRINQNRVKLEASGGIELETIAQIAETGVDFISVGALTKNVQAIDLSMRFI